MKKIAHLLHRSSIFSLQAQLEHQEILLRYIAPGAMMMNWRSRTISLNLMAFRNLKEMYLGPEPAKENVYASDEES